MTTTEEAFSVRFDGPALDQHTMRVDRLAPSLLAMARLFRAAQESLDSEQPPAALDIHATRPGSFAVDLILEVPSLYEQALGMLLSREAQATINATALMGLVLQGLALLKWLPGRRGLRRDVQSGQVRITDENGDSITVPVETLRIVQDAAFRRGAEEMTRPLDEAGIDTMSFEPAGQQEAVVVSSSDRAAFEVPDQPEEVFEPTEREVLVRLENIAFVEGNKWKVNDGENSFYAAVEDLGFLSRVDVGAETFSANDTLRVRLRTQQKKTRKGALQITNTILEVLDHQHGPRQIPLPFDDETM